MLKCKHCGAKVTAKQVGNVAKVFHFCEAKGEYVFHEAIIITDTERLNFMTKSERNINLYYDKLCELHPVSTRDAIDAAMKEQNEQTHSNRS